MTTIVLNSGILHIGTDFVDAVLKTHSAAKSHGKITTECRGLKVNREWVSTLDIAASEKALRKAAADDGMRVSYFQSQAI